MLTPFHGLAFDPARVPTPGDATSPPYDVIDEADRAALLERSPYNVVRLLLADPGDPNYQGAADLLRSWRADGVLTPDPGPRFYVYEMTYPGPEGVRLTARGVLGGLDVVDLGERVVPHEETMPKHRADRLAVLTATGANIDPIIALSSAPDLLPHLEPAGVPRLSFSVDGVDHRLYDVTEPQRIAAIERTVAAHPVSIADGHHRYTTALTYRRSRDDLHGPGPWGQIMALVAPAEGSGLTVGPYHRLFARFPFAAADVETSFAIEATDPIGPTVAGDLVVVRPGHPALLLRARHDAVATLPGPWQRASTAIAREVLYPLLGVDETDAEYVPDAAEAIERAAAYPAGAALLTAPVTEHAIAEAGEAGLRFPQKTTFFVPKPRAGLVIRAFDLEESFSGR